MEGFIVQVTLKQELCVIEPRVLDMLVSKGLMRENNQLPPLRRELDDTATILVIYVFRVCSGCKISPD